MAVKFFTSCDEFVTLKRGTYCWDDLCQYDLERAKIIEVHLRAGTSLQISHHTTTLVDLHNDSDQTLHKKVCLHFKKGICVIISKICRKETPCNLCERWDYIIVGGGSAGSILARKLSDDFRVKVLLIEAGKSHQDDPIILDPNWIPIAPTLLYNPKYSVNYSIPSSNPNNPFGAFPYSEGRGWGGGSMHNFMVAVRGTPRLYDLWTQITGNAIWSYASMLPRMKALEHFFPSPSNAAQSTQRGFDGPISITQSPPLTHTPYLNAMSTVFNAPYISDYNNPNLGVLGTVANQEFKTPAPNSRRSYSGLDFIRIGEVVDKYGNGLHGRQLKIISNAQVLKFRTEKTDFGIRATSVQYVYTGNEAVVQEAHLRSNGTLILAAGSFHTPRVLLSSGVGPTAELEALKIPVVVDSPQVGKNLQDQYGSFAIVTGAADNLSQVYTDLSSPADGIRRVQLSNINIGPGVLQVLPAILSSRSRGSVQIVDSNPLTQPKITIGTYTDGNETAAGSDLQLVVAFYKQLKVAVEAAGGTVLSPPAFAYAGGDAGLATFARTDANIILQSHSVGTARMGMDISTAVVDGELGVFGLENVKVGDASIQPESVDGNTCFSVYYTALTLAEILGVPTPPAL